MKKFLALLLSLVMVLALVACGDKKDDTNTDDQDNNEVTDFKVGFIMLHDENSTYDLNFINAAKEACETLGVEYTIVTNVPEGQECYDKAAELHLDTDKVQLTRIEMTCDGEWTAEQVEEHWPQVHAWHSESGTKDYIRVIGIMLAEKAERNEDVETLINMLGRSSRPKVREYLRTPLVRLPEGAAALVLAEAHGWCDAVVGSM